MTENTTTGGLVEELRALLAEGEHADTCGSVLSPEAGYPCSCWKADLTAALDAHASRTAEATSFLPRDYGGCKACGALVESCADEVGGDCCSSCDHASSSPEPGAVEALAREFIRHSPDFEDCDTELVCSNPKHLARAVLTAGYLSPADVERAVAAAKAEAWDEGKRVAEELDCEATVSWGRCGVAAWSDRPGLFNPYRAAGPERRTEPDEAVSGD